jgi:hypothetical protein
MGHADIAVAGPDHTVEIEVFTVFSTARTERRGMARYSVEALVVRRHSGRDQLELAVR